MLVEASSEPTTPHEVNRDTLQAILGDKLKLLEFCINKHGVLYVIEGMTDVIYMPVQVTPEDLGDIFETAYSCNEFDWWLGYKVVNRPQDQRQPLCDWVKEGYSIELSVDDYGVFTVTQESIRNGIRKYVQGGHILPVDYTGRIDCGDIDANKADMIMQYAVFGELVFS